MRALARERSAELIREAVHESAARARRRPHTHAALAFGWSLRLRDGRWVHLRHDSA